MVSVESGKYFYEEIDPKIIIDVKNGVDLFPSSVKKNMKRKLDPRNDGSMKATRTPDANVRNH